MAESQKYYWLKLKKDFFKRHDIRIIESMPNGKDYSLFYLKLLCESIDHDGKLRFSETIPYNEDMLATITNTNVDIVRSAIAVFSQLDLIEILDDGTYYMSEVENMIGCAANNDNANRQRRFRERQKQLALCERYDSVTKRNESKSIELEKEIDIDKEKEKEKDIDLNISPLISPLMGETKPTKKKESQLDIFERIKGNFNLSDSLQDSIVEWLKYKSQIKHPYKSELGLKNLLKKFEESEKTYGSTKIISVINDTMANGYQGIVWDWLVNKKDDQEDLFEKWGKYV